MCRKLKKVEDWRLIVHFNFLQRFFREIIPIKYENCPIANLPMMIHIVPRRGGDRVNISGYVIINEDIEDISSDIVLNIDSNRCDLQMDKCEKYNAFKMSDMCGKLFNIQGIFKSMIQSFHPPLKCPLTAGNYTLDDKAVVDLSVFSMFPIDGSVWVANFKFIGTFGKTKKIIMCLNSETKIVKTRKLNLT